MYQEISENRVAEGSFPENTEYYQYFNNKGQRYMYTEIAQKILPGRPHFHANPWYYRKNFELFYFKGCMHEH